MIRLVRPLTSSAAFAAPIAPLTPHLPSSTFDQHYSGSGTTTNLQRSLLSKLALRLSAAAESATTSRDASVPMLACALLGPALWSSGGRSVDGGTLVDRCAEMVEREGAAGKIGSGGEAAWVTGRIILASDFLDRPPPPGFDAKSLADSLSSPPSPSDPFSSWAWSYCLQSLARHSDPSLFFHYRESWLSAQPPAGERGTSAAWSDVCAIAAAAQAGDVDTYEAMKCRLPGRCEAAEVGGGRISCEDEIAACLAIPDGDYRAWAAATVAVAAATMGDAPLAAAARESAGRLLPLAGGGLPVAFAFAAFADYVEATPRLRRASGSPGEGDGARSEEWKLSVPGACAALAALG